VQSLSVFRSCRTAQAAGSWCSSLFQANGNDAGAGVALQVLGTGSVGRVGAHWVVLGAVFVNADGDQPLAVVGVDHAFPSPACSRARRNTSTCPSE
jgi:hypothetical protein